MLLDDYEYVVLATSNKMKNCYKVNAKNLEDVEDVKKGLMHHLKVLYLRL